MTDILYLFRKFTRYSHFTDQELIRYLTPSIKNNQYKKHNARKHTHQEALAIDTLMEMVTGIKHEKDITYLAKRPKYGIDNLIGFNANCIK